MNNDLRINTNFLTKQPTTAMYKQWKLTPLVHSKC